MPSCIKRENGVKEDKDRSVSAVKSEGKILDDLPDDFSTGDVNLDDDPSLQEKINPIAAMNTNYNKPSEEGENEKEKKIEDRKNKLSKWALRLFDPNRPRGLVEGPQIIPLNDEYLSAFGKREKEFEKTSGRVVEIDREKIILDEESPDNVLEEEKKKSPKKDLSEESCKVKLSNLAYTTSQKKIENECEKFGPTIDVNLIMDLEKMGNSSVPLSIGRAYVTYEDAESAARCVESMHEKVFDGRIVRARIVPNLTHKSRSNYALKRYWEKNISVRCLRCRKVGHLESECTEEDPRPCCLCATPGHSMRQCPLNTICFNCGTPGHVSRDCTQRKGVVKRMVCTICYESTHHWLVCRGYVHPNLTQDAICIDCGNIGHLSCNRVRWTSGQSPIYCFNCGAAGHLGYDCKRPSFDQCARNCELVLKEIERAWDIQPEEMHSKSYKRGRSNENYFEPNKRARNAPSYSSFSGRERTSRDGYYRSNNNYDRRNNEKSNGHSRTTSSQRRHSQIKHPHQYSSKSSGFYNSRGYR